LISWNKNIINEGKKLIVVVEASWGTTHNWHSNSKQSNRVSATVGNKVGRNQETGRKIIEMCMHNKIDVITKAPLRKFWKSKDGKINHQELIYFVDGISFKTNQEMRDAILIAWDYAGFPIRVKPI
jgi:hypothetical protein